MSFSKTIGNISLSDIEALAIKKKNKKGEIKMICPFCGNKSSFANVNKDVWYCFVCSRRGAINSNGL
ncbi:MAG: hypothetical protein ABH884_03255, partial [Candidatus Komeilibacteria bacterium]